MKSRPAMLLGASSLMVLTLLAGIAAGAVRSQGANPTQEISLACAETRSTDSWECLLEETILLAQRSDVPQALEHLRKQVSSTAALREQCHHYAHITGQTFLRIFGIAAEVPGHSWCGWGYYHGMMQAHGEQNYDTLAEYALQMCQRIGDFAGWGCIHGLGHAAYRPEVPLEESISVCETVALSQAWTCADGVIMEMMFQTDTWSERVDMSLCLSFANIGVQEGCAYGLGRVAYLQGGNLAHECSNLAQQSSIAQHSQRLKQYCEAGFGYSTMASGVNMYSQKSALAPPTDAQLETCSSSSSCSVEFGRQAYLQLLDVSKAVELCTNLLQEPGLQECRAAVARTSSTFGMNGLNPMTDVL